MKRVFSIIWKTLVIWPAGCSFLIAVFSVLDAIQMGKLTGFMSDPDLVLIPLFSYVMFWLPALVAGITFCIIGMLKNGLPVWSVPISALSAFLVLFAYEVSARPYFQSGVTKNTLYSIMAIFAFTACSYVVWWVVRKHWNEFSPT